MAKILIVDDKESNLFALENVLRRLDVQVVKASTGDDALRATLYHDFALAILDVQMPGMDGYELANLLRSDNRTTNIPIIFLSAVYSEEPYVFKGYESGGVDFITKPFNSDVLLSKVRIFLELNEQKERLVQKKATLENLVSRLEVEVEARTRMEEELRTARAELELRVDRRTNELARANEALRKSEEKYRELIESASSVIIRMDAIGHITFINEFGQKLLGCSEQELLGCDPIGTVITRTKDFEQQLSAFVEEVTGHPGTCVEHESRIERKDGEAVWVSWTSKAILDEHGVQSGILGIGTEITARKRTEELLRRADRAFRTLSECNQALVREKEEQGLLHRICRTIVEVGGYRMAWVGFAEFDKKKSVRPVAHAGYDEGYLNLTEITWAETERGKGPTGSAIRTGSIHTAKDFSTNPDFTPWRARALERGYASSIALPLISEGQAFGALTIYAPEPDAFNEEEVRFLDSLAENLSYGITSIRTAIERKRAEEELRVHTAKVELINQELQEFAFIASHDLQEPLRKIQIFGDRLKNVYADILGEAGNDYLTRMENAANRMQQLIRDLLKYSRIATKPDTYSDVDLNDIAKEVLQIFDASLSQTGGRVEIAHLPVVRADVSQMKQLFQNLIGNALKFQQESVSPFVRVYASLNGKVCRIIFEDNGIGFEEKFLDRIFAPFQRLHSQKEFRGTGIGLALCRKIVERHGGNITAQSKPGVGSTFVITLPQRGWD